MRKKKGHNKLREQFDFDKDKASDKLPPWVPFELKPTPGYVLDEPGNSPLADADFEFMHKALNTELVTKAELRKMYKSPDATNLDETLNAFVDLPRNGHTSIQRDNKTELEVQDLSSEIERLKQMLTGKIWVVHKCQCCGATLEIEENKPIVNCKFCGSVHTLSTQQINSTY